MGKVYFPLEVDAIAFRENGDFPVEEVVLHKHAYDPEKNERYNIGWEIDGIEGAPSEVSPIDPTHDAVSQELNSKKAKKKRPVTAKKHPQPETDDDKDGHQMKTKSEVTVKNS